MGMGIMRVGIMVLGVIQCHMCGQATITGTRAGFIIKQYLVAIGPLAKFIVLAIITYMWIVVNLLEQTVIINVLVVQCVV